MDVLTTLFQQQSRRIGILVPSVVVTETHSDVLEITEYPVEMGAAMADHAYKKPAGLVMTVGFAGGGALLDFASGATATGVTGLSPQQIYQQLLDLQSDRLPFDVVTGKRLYANMLIGSLEVTTNQQTENVLSAVITLREVLISRSFTLPVADKAQMKQGVSTSARLNSGTKTTRPPGVTLMPLAAAIVGGNQGD